MHIYKSPEKKSKELKEEKDPKKTLFIFDQVMADREDKMYCQKSKYESVWDSNVKPRDAPKQTQNAPLSSNQVIGWRPPIDDMVTGFNRSAVCQRTFNDVGHL